VLWELSVVEQRYNAVMEVLRDGHTVVEVADRHGVSRQAVHRWLRRYAQGGLDALADRSHRPRSCPHQLPEAVEAVIYQLRRAHPGWGPRRLGHELARRGIDPVPSRAGIYRALVRGGLVEPHARRRQKAAWRRWQRQRPMQLWQMDIMGGLQLAAGGEAKLVTGIDDHSRFCVAAGVVERATARAVCQVFAAALARHGVPEELLTDNGKVFTGRFAPHPGEVLFDRICRENGITHRLTAPRSPTTTGKIERFHKPCGSSCWTGYGSTPWPRLSRSSTCGSPTTTLTDPIRPLAWQHPLSGSPRQPTQPCRLSRRWWLPTNPPTQAPDDRGPVGLGRSPGWSTATASSWSPARSAQSGAAMPANRSSSRSSPPCSTSSARASTSRRSLAPPPGR
jgi:transposase InsO family protein